MTIEIYTTINTILFDGKWSYGKGRLKKKLTTTEEPATSYQKKKLLQQAVKTVDDGEFVISGRNGKYVACDESGRPVWYLYVEWKPLKNKTETSHETRTNNKTETNQ